MAGGGEIRPVRELLELAIAVGVDQQNDSRRAAAAAMRRDERPLEVQLVIEVPDLYVAQIAVSAGRRAAVVDDPEHDVRRVFRIARQGSVPNSLNVAPSGRALSGAAREVGT